ncbi:MAG: TRAP-type C4-dicarboxylate transport system, substrate-binding protein [Myxococcales bacterium]|nr:TRAP-type C4-dicarboxylate transport system, substrate-binding protein [Myxococcales bacterium]
MHALTAFAIVLKIATLAPEGSSWMKLFHQWQGRVETRSEGRVKVKFYAGGVQGDEPEVIRKMRLGQLSGAAITGIGLSKIDPQVRALEASRTYEELDHARDRLGEMLKKKFDEKGFILLGWGDVGPVHVFSQVPIRSLDDLRKTKLWMFGDDSITKDLFAALGLRGVPMGVPEVLPSLATGSIDAFFGSPLSTVALQWSAHAKYVTSAVIGMATGATVITKKAWSELSPEDQKMVIEEARTMEVDVKKQVREDNTKALEKLVKQLGLQIIPTPVEMQREVARRAMTVADKAGAQFSKEFQAEVAKLLEEYRKAHPGELPAR